MIRIWGSTLGVTLALGLMAGCAPSAPPPRPAPAPRPVPTAPSAPAPVASAPVAPPDQCSARDLQYLIGKPRSEIPVPADPSRRRVTCTTCPVTMDYSPTRLNILFDAQTGIIKEVKCG
jgi:hypothetical protein